MTAQAATRKPQSSPDPFKIEDRARFLADFVTPIGDIDHHGPDKLPPRFAVQSATDAGIEYTVKRFGLPLNRWTEWTCDCPFHENNGHKAGEAWRCAHVRAARIYVDRTLQAARLAYRAPREEI